MHVVVLPPPAASGLLHSAALCYALAYGLVVWQYQARLAATLHSHSWHLAVQQNSAGREVQSARRRAERSRGSARALLTSLSLSWPFSRSLAFSAADPR